MGKVQLSLLLGEAGKDGAGMQVLGACMKSSARPPTHPAKDVSRNGINPCADITVLLMNKAAYGLRYFALQGYHVSNQNYLHKARVARLTCAAFSQDTDNQL